MIALCKAVFDRRELDSIIRRIKEGNSPVMICGLSPVHRALAVAAVQAELLCPVAVISQDDVPAAAFAENAAAVSGIEYGVLPSRELVFHNVESFSHEYENKRCDIFSRLSDGTLTAVCGSVEAFLLRTIPPDLWQGGNQNQLGQPVNTELLHRLSELGYSGWSLSRVSSCTEGPYHFPSVSPKAVRIRIFGDRPDSWALTP